MKYKDARETNDIEFIDVSKAIIKELPIDYDDVISLGEPLMLSVDKPGKFKNYKRDFGMFLGMTGRITISIWHDISTPEIIGALASMDYDPIDYNKTPSASTRGVIMGYSGEFVAKIKRSMFIKSMQVNPHPPMPGYVIWGFFDGMNQYNPRNNWGKLKVGRRVFILNVLDLVTNDPKFLFVTEPSRKNVNSSYMATDKRQDAFLHDLAVGSVVALDDEYVTVRFVI